MELSEDGPWPYRHAPDLPSPAAIALSAALAERLDSVVPSPFQVRAEGGLVALYNGPAREGGSDVASVLDQEFDPSADDYEEWPLADRARSVAWSVLSSVQDGISEATTDPWPRLPTGRMAFPGTREDGRNLYLWYGAESMHEATAVLSFPPVPLSELAGQR
jgi:hypothetical protein